MPMQDKITCDNNVNSGRENRAIKTNDLDLDSDFSCDFKVGQHPFKAKCKPMNRLVGP